ncbi:CIC11C00000003366 [Sungouiella intermedia]|uniref:CIC11C00000003366 n=1 Tax=Sungouiella intermedia TaxID=45354 RepID=A0A1L0BFZ9_9ASCO|nr:CIC11C00000003366 [[Candida] intermedia]
MLIADVSATVENLAILVNKKSNELAKLQQEYQEKLEILNKYIGKIEDAEKCEDSTRLEVSKKDSNSLENSQISQLKKLESESLLQDESLESQNSQILHLISSPVCCPNCLEKFYDLSSKSEFVLIPRNKVHLLQNQKANHIIENVQQSIGDLQISELPKKLHGKLKKTCSYCKKPGHSRARCFTRLSRDPSEPKSLEED